MELRKMAQFLCETHLWTLKQQFVAETSDVSYFSYHEKKERADAHSCFEEKQHFAESRDITWFVRNKRPERLRDTLKDVEEMMTSKQCLNLKWLSRQHLQMLLSDATIITYTVSLHSGDINRIFVDKSLVGKLSGEHASDMIRKTDYILVSYPDRPKIDFVHFAKKRSASVDRKFEKLSIFDPKVTTVDVPGPLGRKLRRRIVHSVLSELVLCWWSYGFNDVSPWIPMTGDKELANMVLLEVKGPKLDVVSYTRTPGDIVAAEFSRLRSGQILTVEQSSTSAHNFDVLVSAYSCASDKIHRIAVTAISMKGEVCCTDRSADEERVVIGCSDGSIVLYDTQRKITQITKTELSVELQAAATVAIFVKKAVVPMQCLRTNNINRHTLRIPVIVRWHTSGVFCIVVSAKGEVQLFDMALAPMFLQPVGDKLNAVSTLSISSHFKSVACQLQEALWSPPVDKSEGKVAETSDLLAFNFDKGPVGVFILFRGVASQCSLPALNLVNQYLRTRHFDKAINILRLLDWNVAGKLCYACMSAVVNHLLKMPLNQARESELYEALGCFYNSSRPLSEVTVLEFRESMNQLARRFFHHLLRYGCFEKAFLLAVDIGAKDLFLDMHYAAKDRGEKALSEVALQKAHEVDGEDIKWRSKNCGPQCYEDLSSRRTESVESLDSLGHSNDSDDDITRDQMAMFRAANRQGSNEFGRVNDTDPLETSHHRDASELVCARLEADLASHFNDEFTKTFYQPHPTQGADVENDEEQSESVHVVHFGIV